VVVGINVSLFVSCANAGKAFSASACLLAATQGAMLLATQTGDGHAQALPQQSVVELGLASCGVAVGSAAMLALVSGWCVGDSHNTNTPKRARVVKLGDFWH
jgi:hypothetical protein